jgi:hypothetical protein
MLPFYILFSGGMTYFEEKGNFLFKDYLGLLRKRILPEMGRSLDHGRISGFMISS